MLDPFDQFYWEHRMATWQGVAMSERDFYAEPFIPYNSRRVFEAMLGAPFASRRADEAALRMVEMVDPRLLEFPINPKTWSRPKAVQLGLRASSSEHTSGAKGVVVIRRRHHACPHEANGGRFFWALILTGLRAGFSTKQSVNGHRF